MSDINIQQLLRDANNIRTEKDPGDNDAERVGKMFVDIIEYIRTHSGSGSSEGGDTPTPTPTPTPSGGNTFNNGIIVTAGGASINGNTSITGALNVNGNITGKTITGDQLNSNGTITARGDIESTNGGLTVSDDIRSNNGTVYAPNAVFDYLTVNKSAHFFELILDQLRANKGAILITNGQCKADAVDGYRVYYRADDGNTENAKAIHQSFIVGDLAICQTFGDGVKVGTNTNITTTYYWRAVSAVSANPVQRSDGKYYHWIELSNATGRYDSGSGAPKIGDEIVQLGYNPTWSSNPLTGNDLISRQSAIILSAYQTKDAGVVPPSLAFYQGINDFTLSSHRATFIDTTGGHFKGVIEAGSSVAPGTELDVNTETYQLIPSNNPIVKGIPSVTFSVFKSDGSSGYILDHDQLVTEGLYCEVSLNGVAMSDLETPATGNVFTLELAANTTGRLELLLIDGSDNTKTKFVTTVIDLGTVTNGVNGQYTQIIFKNAATKPSAPTPPNTASIGDWSNGLSTPSSGQTIWVCTRVVTPQANGTIVYDDWSDVVQFNGTNGINGTNGTNGSNGTNGEDGDPGESWTLAAIAEAFEVRIAHGEHRKLEEVVGTLYTNLTYSLIHTVGDAPEVLEDLTGYTITIESDNTAGTTSFTPIVNQGVITFVPTDNNLLKQILVTAGNTDQWNYYWLYDHKDEVSTYNNNRWGQFMPTKLTVTVTKDGALLASRVVPLIFSAQGYFGALQDGLISIYQGLSGNTDTNWQTGFSQIKQTWDKISFNVSNLQSITNGTTFQDTPYIKYAFYRRNASYTTAPAKPSRSATIATGIAEETWSSNRSLAVNATTPRLYYIYKTSANPLDSSSSTWDNIEWSNPAIYKYWDGSKVVNNLQTVNNAALDIKADEIQSTVEQSISNNYYSKSTIDQKANEINLSVTQKTAGNQNYFVNPAFGDKGLLKTNWNLVNENANPLTPETIIHSIWRYAPQTTCPGYQIDLTNGGTTYNTYTINSNRCAILSSYPAIPLKSNSLKSEVIQNVSLSEANPYTFSIWAKRFIGTSTNCIIGLGVYGDVDVEKVMAFDEATTVSGRKTLPTSSTSTVTIDRQTRYAEFTLLDDNWHLLVIQLTSNVTASCSAWIGLGGNSTTYREVYVSRPFFTNGEGLDNLTDKMYAVYRLYGLSGYDNMLNNSTLESSTITNQWKKVLTTKDQSTSDPKVLTWEYSDNEWKITGDALSEGLIDRLYSTNTYPNAVQLSGTTSALRVSTTTDYRPAHALQLKQEFSSTLANQLKDETFVFSVYIKRGTNWSNKAKDYSQNPDLDLTTLMPGLYGEHINQPTAGSEDSTIIPGSWDSTVSMQRFTVLVNDFNWHRIWWKFKLDITSTQNALTEGFSLGFWTNINTGGIGDDWLFMKPMLEVVKSSVEIPSMWTDNSDDIKSGLSRTGIDISAGKINLQADKVTFSDTTGLITDKISINPATGTLNAVDGNFSGVITANTTYSPFIPLTAEDFTSGEYFNKGYLINPANGSNYLITNTPTSNTWGLLLPNASNWDGLKLTIFTPWYSRTASFYNFNLVSLDQLIYYKITTGASYYGEADMLKLPYNDIIEIQSINGAWYVLTEDVTTLD